MLIGCIALLAWSAACSAEFLDPDPSGAGDAGRRRSGEPAKIVFFGDSITEAGAKPGGYVTLVETSLEYLYPNREIEVIGAGKVGNRVPDLLDRVRRDVLSKSPTHVVIYIGVNDVGRAPPPGGNTGLASYRNGLAELVRRIKGSGAEVIVCTPGVIGENPSTPTRENRLLDQYAEASRQVAQAAGARICDLRAAFTGYLVEVNTAGRSEGILTYDGVHLNSEGNRFVARQIVSTITDELDGRPDAQAARANPNGGE